MDEPKHHEVGGDAQQHVCELQTQIPNENSGLVLALFVPGLSPRPVQRSVGDEDQRGVEMQILHDCWLDQLQQEKLKLESAVKNTSQTKSVYFIQNPLTAKSVES